MKAATAEKVAKQWPDDDRLVCKACGVDAGCSHRAAKVKASERALDMVQAHPEWSDPVIAEKCKVHKNTVARARSSGCPNGQPEKRTGKDGKQYPAKKPKKKKVTPPDQRPSLTISDPMQEEMEDDAIATDEQRWQHSAASFLGDLLAMRAFWNRHFGKPNILRFEKPSALLTLAKDAEREIVDLLKTIRGN